MAPAPEYLVEILVPKEKGDGSRVGRQWFDSLLKELATKFGGVTSFFRQPDTGLWDRGGEVERDAIAIIEVMVASIDEAYWQSLRKRVEHDLGQEEIIIRAQTIARL